MGATRLIESLASQEEAAHDRNDVDAHHEDPPIARRPREVVGMTVTYIAIGVAVLAAIAVAVGVIDAARARQWREVAAERRQRWETRQRYQHEFHGRVDSPEIDDD